jgi:hypothetical protein
MLTPLSPVDQHSRPQPEPLLKDRSSKAFVWDLRRATPSCPQGTQVLTNSVSSGFPANVPPEFAMAAVHIGRAISSQG